MNRKKVKLGQFYTKESTWLRPHIRQFIADSGCTVAYDPFAGDGDLLKIADSYAIGDCVGLDIDPTHGWAVNDSLVHIPHRDNAIIITNPPYLSNYSASRKKIYRSVARYFDNSSYDDLYLIALDTMLQAQEYVVAIVPETFINSSFRDKSRLASITILEENPFADTDAPVCVVCFDGVAKAYDAIDVYKNDTFVNNLGAIERLRLKPDRSVAITFNVLQAWLGLRAVDTTDPQTPIHFDFKENFNYDWERGIKVSSRLLSTIAIDIPPAGRQRFIDACNANLHTLREQTQDVILSPFKGNMKNGVRRRRLDFATARAIMEQAYHTLYGGNANAD